MEHTSPLTLNTKACSTQIAGRVGLSSLVSVCTAPLLEPTPSYHMGSAHLRHLVFT